MLSEILPNEKDLFLLISQGNEKAFSEVFHYYNKRLYPFVLKMIKSKYQAEEIVQEVFAKLWVNRHTLTEIKSPRSYIFTMATNRTLDHLKKIAGETRLIKEIVQVMENIQHNEIEEWFDGREGQQRIQEAINSLPPQRQKIYRLNRIEGKSYKEIAEELNISPNTVKNQLIQAVRSIKAHLQNTRGSSMALLYFFVEMYKR